MTKDASAHSDRLLAEVVCALEEAEARPRETPDADLVARAAGGDFARRIRTRAGALIGAAALRIRIARSRGTIRAAAWTLWTVSAIAGAIAALSVGAARTINVPLALLLLVGLNLLLLGLWLLAQLAYRFVAHATRGMFERLSGLLARVRGAADEPELAVLRVLMSGAHGRWLLGSVLHAAWLAYTAAALLALVLLLGFTSYEVSWQTTLFDQARLEGIARALNTVPSLLGLSAPEVPATAAGAAASRDWGWWLLCAIVAYGAVPRAIALAASYALLLRARRRFGTDLTRPGFARLRQRLMPDVDDIGVIDPTPPGERRAEARSEPVAALAGEVHGVWLEGAEGEAPPALPGVAWRWLGNVDSADSRRALVERLRGERIATLAVVVRATATPDRGVERALAEIAAASGAPVRLVIAKLEQLEARGPEAMASRVADWRELGIRAHAPVASVTRTAPGAEGAGR